MPLFLIYFYFKHGYRYEYIEHTLVCLGFALWMVLEIIGILTAEEMSCCHFCGLKPVELLCHPPTGLKPMPHTSVALTAQYLYVCQRKLGTIIIQTVRPSISYSMKAHAIQITLPGSSTVTPP
jgi:hypothetical protein